VVLVTACAPERAATLQAALHDPRRTAGVVVAAGTASIVRVDAAPRVEVVSGMLAELSSTALMAALKGVAAPGAALALPQPVCSWEQAAAAFRDPIADYFLARGLDPDAAGPRATLATNSDLVASRVALLETTLRLVLGEAGFAGRTVLDVGCGYGAIATYLALDGGADEVIATDLAEHYVRPATRVIERLGLEQRVRLHRCDMRHLTTLGLGPFDDVVVNNSLIYMRSGRDVGRALREVRAMLRPRGRVVLYNPNRWQRRDPFTGTRWIHAAPRPLARLAARSGRVAHRLDDVRLVSPLELAGRLRALGFRDVGIVGFGPGAPQHEGRERLRAPYFGVAARRGA
jgi:SAM-dependent methyltransferase